jgi:hypothetical protein
MPAQMPGELNGGSDGSLGSPHAHDQVAGGFADSRVAAEARSSGNLPQHTLGAAMHQHSALSSGEPQR